MWLSIISVYDKVFMIKIIYVAFKQFTCKSMFKVGNSQTLIHMFIHLKPLQCIAYSHLAYSDIGLTVPW